LFCVLFKLFESIAFEANLESHKQIVQRFEGMSSHIFNIS
jgi:hypothetical protein